MFHVEHNNQTFSLDDRHSERSIARYEQSSERGRRAQTCKGKPQKGIKEVEQAKRRSSFQNEISICLALLVAVVLARSPAVVVCVCKDSTTHLHNQKKQVKKS